MASDGLTSFPRLGGEDSAVGFPAGKTVAVVGGGQLGRMLALAGLPLGLDFAFLDPSGDGCAAAARCGSTNAQLGGAAGDVGRDDVRWPHDGATDEEMVCVTGSGLRGGRVGDRGESGMPAK